MRACVCACVCVCVGACVRACVRVCVLGGAPPLLIGRYYSFHCLNLQCSLAVSGSRAGVKV